MHTNHTRSKMSRYSKAEASPLQHSYGASSSFFVFYSLCSVARKYAWIDGNCSEAGRQTRRDVPQMRTRAVEGDGREKGRERKFIKLRSSCPERSRSNWKKSDFQIIDLTGVGIEQARLDISS